MLFIGSLSKVNIHVADGLKSNQSYEGDHIVTKRAKKTRAFKTEEQNQVIDFKKFRNRKQHVVLLPKNISQENYIDLLEDPTKDIVLAAGPAGTGKTMLAVLAALKAFKEGECEKIVITRPAVCVDEQHGFLPGSLLEKMAPWVIPIMDVIEEYYSPKEILSLVEEKIIEVAPLAYMRGRTFKNSFIIADETQSCTVNQMKMLLTRLGANSKIVLTGDLKQHERGFEENGLKDFLELLKSKNSTRIGMIQFEQSDVERHPTVREVLSIYGDE